MLVASCKQLNPFLGEWNTPYGIPDFKSIKESDYVQAVKFGIRQQEGQIDAIIASGGVPDFENTIAAYELSGEILDRVTGVLFNLSESDATPSMQKIVEKVIPMLTEHNDNVFMNPYFFGRVDELYRNRDSLDLTREQEMTLEKIHRAFIDNGVALDPESQSRLREINKELAVLEQRFGNNVLSQTNSFRLVLTDSSEIAGLPSAVLASASAAASQAGISRREAARIKGIDESAIAEGGPWLFTLHNPSYVPFMTGSARRDLRKEMFTAYSTRCNGSGSTDNRPVVLDIMRLRIEKARLLGYASPAEQILSDKMAHDPQTVDSFLERIFPAAVSQARKEVEDMQLLMDRDVEAGLLPDDSTSVIMPWDWAYYAEKVRQEKYDLNEDIIKPYFRMENVRKGVFSTAHRLYGLNFEALDSVEFYHPDVEGFKVTDSDGLIAEKDSLGRISYRAVTVEENINRLNYRQSDNINYLDGDLASQLGSAETWKMSYNEEEEDEGFTESEEDLEGGEGTQQTKSATGTMYEYEKTSMVDDKVRVVKGGSWKDRAFYLSPGQRRYLDQTRSTDWIGFRCAMDRAGSREQ